MTKAQYKEHCRKNSTALRDRFIEQGYHLGTMPFGYQWQRIGSRRRGVSQGIVNDAEAVIVKKIFELYASGNYTLATLTDYIMKDCPNIRRCHRSIVNKVLSNPFYIGKIRKSDGTTYDHVYPTFISPELFDQVQKRLKRNRTLKLSHTRNFGLYRGLMQCGACGCRITLEQKKGKHVYYHCTWTKEPHEKVTLSETQITEQLYKAFAHLNLKIPKYLNKDDLYRWCNEHFDNIYLNLDRTITLVPRGHGYPYVIPAKRKTKNNTAALQTPQLTNTAELVYTHLSTPRSIDELISTTHLDLTSLQHTLTDLELDNYITQEAGLWKRLQ